VTSVEEYLDAMYRPDCDYIDGELAERNAGERSHRHVQGDVYMWFRTRERALKVQEVMEVRLRIGTTRFRIPDVMVLAADAPHEEVVVAPPLLCIEILSPRHSLKQTWARSKDYLSTGVPTCWIIDPLSAEAWIVTSAGLTVAEDGILRAGDIAMPLAEVID
jgi:Uma2 family endonuclease